MKIETFPPAPHSFRGLWCVSYWNNSTGNYSGQLGQAFIYNNGTFTLNFLNDPTNTWVCESILCVFFFDRFLDSFRSIILFKFIRWVEKERIMFSLILHKVFELLESKRSNFCFFFSKGSAEFFNKTSCFWRRQIPNGDIVWGRQSNGTCTPAFEYEETDPWIVYTQNAPDCHYIDDENPNQMLSNTPFESDLLDFDRSIKDSKPSESIVFYGSSSIRFWSTLANDFANTKLNIINRGFGGSTLEQCYQQFKRIIQPLEPRLLIVYAGENDVTENSTAISVQSHFHQFIQITRRFFPVLPIVYISIKPSPSRLNVLDKQNYTNHLIREDIQTMANVDYIDIFNSMLTANNTPRQELFTSDDLHMNEQGYAIWTQAVQGYLNTHGYISKGFITCELSFVLIALNIFVLFFA